MRTCWRESEGRGEGRRGPALQDHPASDGKGEGVEGGGGGGGGGVMIGGVLYKIQVQ